MEAQREVSQYTTSATHELLRDMYSTLRGTEFLQVQIFEELKQIKRILIKQQHPITNFTPIKEISMVPLAAGQTATFSTTPLPAGSTPLASGLVWSSSDSTNAPVSSNLTADPTGLSTLVVFPSTVVAGVNFSLTLSYTNSDGTVATQTNSFVTVAPAAQDVTGFNPIVQSA